MKNIISSILILFFITSFYSCNTKSKPDQSEVKPDSTSVNKIVPGKYCNEKYGFCISFPESDFTVTENENGEGAIIASNDGLAQIDIHRGNLDGNITGGVNNLKQAYDTDIKQRGARELSYNAFESTHYILMGLEGKVILYQKTIISKGEIVTAIFTYHDKAKGTYYPMIEPIFKSFK